MGDEFFSLQTLLEQDARFKWLWGEDKFHLILLAKEENQ